MQLSPQSQDVVLGVDIGGTKMFVGLVSRQGKILHSRRSPMRRVSREELFSLLSEGIAQVLQETDQRPQAIGIGLKGHIDANNNRILSSSLLDMDGPYDLCADLTRRYGIPAAIDNDVNAATLAEARLGAGRTSDHFVYVNIGTGSAIGVYGEGRLLRGRGNACGEIGYTLCHSPGTESDLFCLEDAASGKGLDNEIRRLLPLYPSSILGSAIAQISPENGAKVEADQIFQAYQAGDPLALHAVNGALDALAVSLVNFECLLDFGLYLFGGGIVTEPWFFAAMETRVRRLICAHRLPLRMEMRMSALGAANVGLLGASCVAFGALGP